MFSKEKNESHMFIRTISRAFSKLEDGGKKRGGGVSDSLLDVRKRGGGGLPDEYYVQQGGWGGLKIRKKCVCN